MLHIVQVVFAGVAATPQVFLDQAAAESAFVEQVKGSWRQSYSAYCEGSDAAMDAFASARAFLDTLDLSEKGRINYWTVSPEGGRPDTLQDLAGLRQLRENIGKLVKQVETRSAAVRDELSGLLEDIAQLSGTVGEVDAPAAAVQPVAPEGSTAPAPAPAQKTERVEDAEKYATKEWKSFVGFIMNLSGGSRSDFPLLPRPDWRQEVYSDLTELEYWEWVAVKIDKYKEAAEKAGYSVIADPASPGHYKFKTPDGTVAEPSFISDWEAWCYAGMEVA